jgi:hypothetical protein
MSYTSVDSFRAGPGCSSILILFGKKTQVLQLRTVQWDVNTPQGVACNVFIWLLWQRNAHTPWLSHRSNPNVKLPSPPFPLANILFPEFTRMAGTCLDVAMTSRFLWVQAIYSDFKDVLTSKKFSPRFHKSLQYILWKSVLWKTWLS